MSVTLAAFTFGAIALGVLVWVNRMLLEFCRELTAQITDVNLAKVDTPAARIAVSAQRALDTKKSEVARQMGQKQRAEILARQAAIQPPKPQAHGITPWHNVIAQKRKEAHERVTAFGVRPVTPPMESGGGPVDGVVPVGGDSVPPAGEPGEDR